jgi:purine-binding chemotaxis protein CheW
MNNSQKFDQHQIVVFTLEERHYALPLSVVQRVIRAVEITPLPKAPEIVMGVINIQGQILPVIDIRKRFRLPSREIALDDQFIIARTSKRLVVLVVDAVAGVNELERKHIVDAKEEFPYSNFLSGIATIDTDIVFINDLEKFLSLEEERVLDEALTGGDE